MGRPVLNSVSPARPSGRHRKLLLNRKTPARVLMPCPTNRRKTRPWLPQTDRSRPPPTSPNLCLTPLSKRLSLAGIKPRSPDQPLWPNPPSRHQLPHWPSRCRTVTSIQSSRPIRNRLMGPRPLCVGRILGSSPNRFCRTPSSLSRPRQSAPNSPVRRSRLRPVVLIPSATCGSLSCPL